MPDELTPAQAAAVAELERVLGLFAVALEGIRDADMSVVDGFRAAGIDIPPFVPAGLLENLLLPAA
jgi:hypothetical protein